MVMTTKMDVRESDPDRGRHGSSTEEELRQEIELREQEELRREGELVASGGRISKRTMAIAFGLAFIFLAVFSTSALESWATGILSLVGLYQ